MWNSFKLKFQQKQRRQNFLTQRKFSTSKKGPLRNYNLELLSQIYDYSRDGSSLNISLNLLIPYSILLTVMFIYLVGRIVTGRGVYV